MIKNIIKKILVVIFGKKISDSYLKNSPIVSFDIFDTLVIRSVDKPKNVFKKVGQLLCDGKEDAQDAFFSMRVEAEKKARDLKRGVEVTLDDIYDCMNIDTKQKEYLKKLEIEMECNSCLPNEEVVDVYRTLLKQGKRLVITSDIYLSRDVITFILEKCGIKDYEKLYISSELGNTKRDGTLFEHVLRDLDANPKDIIHIGDNPRGDYFIPISKGINAFLIKQKRGAVLTNNR